MLSLMFNPSSRVIAIPRATKKGEHKTIVCQSYREILTSMNKADFECIKAENKKELVNFYRFLDITNQLSEFDEGILDTFEENFTKKMHHVFIQYTKPLSARRRIALRDMMLPYLENSDEHQARFLEDILKYYGCL